MGLSSTREAEGRDEEAMRTYLMRKGKELVDEETLRGKMVVRDKIVREKHKRQKR